MPAAAALQTVSSATLHAVNLNHPGHYLHWGVVQISVANFVVIVVMVAILIAAILLPFPGSRRHK